MAFITLSGTLLDPNGDLAVGDQIRFTHKSTTGETVESAVSIITINPTGTYSLPLQYGLVLVEYKDVRNGQFKNLGIATVNSSNPATTIPELLNALVPVSSAELIEFQGILADCVTAQTAAENAATTAEAFAYQLTTTDLIASTATFTADTNIPTSGFTTSGDGGNGLWLQNGATGQTPSQSPAQLGNALLNDGNGNQWSLIVIENINILSLGAKINTDSTGAIFAAVNYALTFNGSISAPSGNYILSGSNTLEIDLGKISLYGSGSCTFNCSAMTATDAVQIYSSAAYPARHNSVNKMSGILFQGNSTAGRHGLLVGHPTNAYNGQINVENCAFFEFDRNHHYTNNAWRVGFRFCAFGRGLNYQLFCPAGITNAGESMSYYHCQLHDNLAKIRIESDVLMFNFYACSILNTPFEITGLANTVSFFGGNNENPGSGPVVEYPYMKITGRDNLVTYDAMRLTFRRTGQYYDSPFVVDNPLSCIVFENIVWPDGGNFEFEVNGTERTWCKGAGSVMIGKNFFTGGSLGRKFPIAKAATSLRNGDFELGAMTGWTVTEFAAAGSTAIASTTAAINGTYGLLVDSVPNGGANVTQEVPCAAGVLVYAGCNHIVTTVGSGTTGFFQLLFKDADGDTILVRSDIIGSTSALWIGSNLSGISPAGTVSVTLNINVSASTTPHIFHIDDIVLNICS